MALTQALARVPGLGGYLAQQQINEQQPLAELKQASDAMGLMAALHKHQQEQAFRAALANAKTPEEQVAVAVKFGGPEAIMKHADRQSQIAATKEATLARLSQQAKDSDMKYELAIRNAKTREEAAAWTKQRDMARLALQQAALRMTGERLFYDTGAKAEVPDVLPAAAPAAAPATAPESRLPAGVPESDRAAFNLAKSGIPAVADRQITPEELSRMADVPAQVVPMPGSLQPAAGAGTPATMPNPAPAMPDPSVPMPDAGNLDARDIQARQAAPAAPAGTQPAPAPSVAPAAPTAPQMPQFTGSPRQQAEARNRWLREQSRPSISGGAQMSDEAIRDLAVQSLYDSTVLAGYRRDTKAMGRIADARVKIMKEAGVTSEDVVSGRAGFKADMASLQKITPQYDAITAFEKTAIRNGKILIDLGNKVDSTGVPVIERWVRAGRKAVVGDTDVAKFHAQIHLYRAEAARILTQPNLSGVLTDTAREEMEHVLKNDATAQQIREVVNLLERDFNNRKETLEEQIGAIRTRMAGRVAPGGGGGVTQPPAGAPAAPASPQKIEELLKKHGRRS